nr:15809_t:CDS:2 [Entrophospora candida]
MRIKADFTRIMSITPTTLPIAIINDIRNGFGAKSILEDDTIQKHYLDVTLSPLQASNILYDSILQFLFAD